MNRIFLLSIILGLTLNFGCAVVETNYALTDAELNEDLRLLPQDLNVYLQSAAGFAGQNFTEFSQAGLMTQEQQEQVAGKTRARFYAPWDKIWEKTGEKRIAPQEAMWGLFSLKAENGFAENLRPYPAERWEELKQNCAVGSFPNSSIRAITVRRCDLRLLPTDSPYFFNPARPGQGYPFDFYQNSALPLGSPVRVIHISKDQQWGFIEHSSAMGWVRLAGLAEVDEVFISSWKGKAPAAVLKDKVFLEIGNSSGHGASSASGLPQLSEEAGIGALLPYAQESGKKHEQEAGLTVYFPIRGHDGKACLRSCVLSPHEAAPWPIPLTRQNIARLGNRMMGQPYGWGGYGGNRDCSALLRDLFVPFGLWLPRNSAAQAKYGRVTSLVGLTPEVKEQAILRLGQPFLSLVSMPGHIALYLGSYEGRAIIFHSLWGLRTTLPRSVFGKQRSGRMIVGKAVVTTTTLGAEKENIATPHSLLDLMTGMNDLLSN
jgi:hypothetical protein